MATLRSSLGVLCVGILAVSALSSCQTPPPSEIITEEAEVAQPEEGNIRDLEALTEVEVDTGLFLVDITLPSDFTEGLSQEDLENELSENGFRSATLNDDGSVTYTMTKSRHNEVLAELRESIRDSVNGFIADEPETYSSISFDRDLRNFTVTVNAENFNGEAPWLEFSLAFQAGFYYIFAGTSEENPTLKINYVDAATGNILATSTWPKD